VRQPEIVRLLTLLFAILLVVPVARTAGDLALGAAFLVEFLSEGAWRPLSMLTPTPHRESMSVPGAAVDRWVGAAIVPVPLVLVHGYSPEGKDDPRVREAAALLARAGFDVAVPTVPGLTRGQLRPQDVEPVVATLAARSAPTVMISVSVGAGPALLAAAEPAVRERVRVILSLGGYASAAELLRFFLTGDFRWGAIRGHVTHDREIVRQFVEANADLLDLPTREILADPTRVASMLEAPPPALTHLLDQLSPERVARQIRARLVLVHGTHDRAVPYTESLRLAAARPERTRVVLVGVLDHVEATRGASWLSGARELSSLLLAMYSLTRAS
jgi:pimeloyl-ACP methyl ester carboxylesterase